MQRMYKTIISIHGAPRSGTSWLGQIFDSSPDVRHKWQPLFSYSFKDRISLQSTKEEILEYYDTLYSYEDDFLDRKLQRERGIYPVFEKKEENPEFLVPKLTRYHYLVPYQLELFDFFKVVGIVRHPCGCLNSFKHAPREFNPAWDWEKEWRFAQSKNLYRPENYYGFHKWQEVTKMFLDMEVQYPDRFYLIRYEKLVHDTMEEVRKMFDFFGIEMTDQTVRFIEQSRSVHQDDLYSVFKGKKDINDWKDQLDTFVIDAVLNELAGTEFERFLGDV